MSIKSHKYIREAAFAGQFYPDRKDELQKELEILFGKAVPLSAEKKNLRALISPHAGYIFSGKVAASAYNQIPDNAVYKRVFVLASSHRYSFKGASVYCEGNYETPLGEIEIDQELIKKLAGSSEFFSDNPEPHLQEHSLEVQLPFLQYKLGNSFLLVPIILGTNRAEDCKNIAEALEPYFTPENLFVVSTDFSHYPKYDDAVEVDGKTAEAICSNQAQKLKSILDENRMGGFRNLATSLCGWTSVLTLLHLTGNKPYSFNKVDYQNSGDAQLYRDKSRVVGYWAIAIHNTDDAFFISENEKNEILEIARESIISYVKTGKRGKLIVPKSSGILNEKTGVFVSIYVNKKLRGCIGGFAQEKTLNELIQRMSVSAACDKRFKNIKKDDLEQMKLEISVLTPLTKIDSIDEIKLGKHGILIQQEFYSGTLLPQVATKNNWSLEQFLGHCSRDKAGLAWDGWKTADIFTYEAVIIKES